MTISREFPKKQVSDRNLRNEEPTYPLSKMKPSTKTLGEKEYSTADKVKESIPKDEMMDRQLSCVNSVLTGKEIRRVVNDVFQINLDIISEEGNGSLFALYSHDIMEGVKTSLRKNSDSGDLDARIMAMKKAEVMDAYLESQHKRINGPEIRIIINEIYGINLGAIASMDTARISIFSKGKWILQKNTDLFVVYTSKRDTEVKVYPTTFYHQQTGNNELPSELQNELINMGYSFREEEGAYYIEPNGVAISDYFKGKTMNVLREAIRDMTSIQ